MRGIRTSAPVTAYQDEAAINAYSVYRLFPEEIHLFSKYYRPGDRIADLGCGLGRTTLRLHEMGCLVTGVDLSKPFIELASRRFPDIDFHHSSFTHTRLPSADFDHVLISFNSLDDAYPESERELALAEAGRLLKLGGTLLFSSHNLRSILLSPKYSTVSMNLWRLRHYVKAFGEKAYIYDRWNRCDLFYTTSGYARRQTERHGFDFVERVGLRASQSTFVAEWLSPHIHYLFRKHV